MIRLFFLYGWPALVTFTCYLLWWIWQYKQAKAGVLPHHALRQSYIRGLTIILAIAICCFLFVIQQNVLKKSTIYEPARFEDGKLIPAKTR